MLSQAAARAFTPVRLGPITLRNRFVKTATFEGMSPDGVPSPALVEHHRGIAAGGTAMTTVAYCSVARHGLTFEHQLWMRREIVAQLRKLTDAVHDEGGAAAIQLGHAGYFADKHVIGARPMGASRALNLYGMSICREMTEDDIARLLDDFASAARLAVESGFDCLEVHVGHGYLLSQFVSPFTNRRRDGWGGSLEKRVRLPCEVVSRVRDAAGGRVAVIAKMNLDDGFRGGVTHDDAVQVARALEAAGADGLVPSGGFVSRTPFYMLRGTVPVNEMVAIQPGVVRRLGLKLFGRIVVKEYPFTENFFFDGAKRVREAVTIPVALLGGVKTLAGIERAMSAGFELVSMGRALIAEPDLPRRLEAGLTTESRCVPCNLCVVEMEKGGVRCVRL